MTMKVTVCFGPVKIIVPCGEGTLTVQDLMEKSIQRYRKALGKDDHYWVKVHSLQCQSDGAILDADDLVSDVADDREKLSALFEEEETGSGKDQMISDGTESSIGTMSPISMSELNHINNSNNKLISNGGFHDENGEMDIVVTGQEVESKLKVRQNGALPNKSHTVPRAAASTRLDSNANNLPLKNGNGHMSDDDAEVAAFDRFSRDSSRRSLSNTHPSVFKWAEAQQKIEDTVNQDPTSPSSPPAKEQIMIEMVNDGTPLGIHIIAKVENADGSGFGLVVHGIENGGRAAHDKRLLPGDHIMAINNDNITQETFDKAQDMMREAMRTPTVKLLVERDMTERPTSPPKAPPPTVPRRSPQTNLTTPEKGPVPPGQMSLKRLGWKLYIQLMKGPQGLGFSVTSRDNPILGKHPIYIKNILPNGAAIVDGRLKPGDRLMEVNGIEMTGKTQEEAVSILRSVRRGGVVNLVVSRQESVEADQTFPRVLTQGRQGKGTRKRSSKDKAFGKPTTAGGKTTDLASPDDQPNPNAKTILDFNIALNDTGSAGLGVSVKGKTTGGGNGGETRDLGIFIKSVMHGGAASKDGRLRPNDQLLYINDVSLVDMSNSQAMDTLRKAMTSEKSPRSTIRLMIARRQDVAETFHRALSKPGESGVEASPDRGIDVDNRTMRFGEGNRTMRFGEGKPRERIPSDRSSQGPGTGGDQGSLLQNIADTLSEKHNVDLSPMGPPSPSGVQTASRARVMYPHSGGATTVDAYHMGGRTLPGSSQENALIDNGGLQVQVDISSIASTMSVSPKSPRAPSPPEWLYNPDQKGDGGESPPLSPELLSRDQFQRDSKARLSFSERKQGGSLDAKEMSWYKKKKAEKGQTEELAPLQRDVAASTGSLVRASSMDSLLDNKPRKPLGESLDHSEGMKKSNSMDRLIDREQDRRTSTEFRPSRRRVSRKNPLNNSFRAAVDKSLPAEDTQSECSSPGRDKKKKKKEAGNTGTSTRSIKGFFGFGKTRKSSVEDDKYSDISKDEEPGLTRDDELHAEQERMQETLQRKREESNEARRVAERMMELKMKYEHTPPEHPRHHHPREETGSPHGPPQEPMDRHSPRGEPKVPSGDARYERLSEGRSHPEPKYMEYNGVRRDDYPNSHRQKSYDTYDHRSNNDNFDDDNYDNFTPKKYDHDRRTHDYRGSSDHYRGRGYEDDRGSRYYQTERTRGRSEGNYRDQERPPGKTGKPVTRQESQETSSSREGREGREEKTPEKRHSDRKSKEKRESPAFEKTEKGREEGPKGVGQESSKDNEGEKDKEGSKGGVGSIFRRGSKGGSKKEKKGSKKERSDSEREEDRKGKPSEKNREAPESTVPEEHGDGQRGSRSREDQWRQQGREGGRDRPSEDRGYGRRHRSHERPSRRDRRSEDYREDDRRRAAGRPAYDDRGMRLRAGDPRDVGSLDRLNQRDSQGDHYRPRRADDHRGYQDGWNPPTRDHHRPTANGDPHYPPGAYSQGQSSIHQRSRSYDTQEFTNYSDSYGPTNPPLNPRTGYSRGPYDDSHRSRDNPARV